MNDAALIAKILGETTTAGSIPAVSSGALVAANPALSPARKKFKFRARSEPRTPRQTIEALAGSKHEPGEPVNPEPEKTAPEPKPRTVPKPEEPKIPPAEPSEFEPGMTDTAPSASIIPDDAVPITSDGEALQTKVTRADRAVLDLFMPKPKADQTAQSPAPVVSEAAAAALFNIGGEGASGTLPSGQMPEHAPSPDGAARVLEAMRRFVR